MNLGAALMPMDGDHIMDGLVNAHGMGLAEPADHGQAAGEERPFGDNTGAGNPGRVFGAYQNETAHPVVDSIFIVLSFDQ